MFLLLRETKKLENIGTNCIEKEIKMIDFELDIQSYEVLMPSEEFSVVRVYLLERIECNNL